MKACSPDTTKADFPVALTGFLKMSLLWWQTLKSSSPLPAHFQPLSEVHCPFRCVIQLEPHCKINLQMDYC